jgi:hypothetical protein
MEKIMYFFILLLWGFLATGLAMISPFALIGFIALTAFLFFAYINKGNI